MSTWTFRNGVLATVALILLAGCAQGPDVMRRATGAMTRLPETVAVAGRSVVIGGPAGYCVDRGASRLGGDTAFVLLGSCASITGEPDVGAPAFPGVLMASVDKEAASDLAVGATIDQIERFLTTPEGRAALARDGRAGSVQVLDSRRENSALYIHLRDSSAELVPGMSQEYWRGLFDVNRHLVTVSVMTFADQPIGVDAGLNTLRGFHDRIRNETRQIAAGERSSRPRPFGNMLN